MSRAYNPTAMYRYGAMQKAGGSGSKSNPTLLTPWINFNNAVSFSSQAPGDVPWTNPADAQFDDATYATCSMGIFQESEYLRCLDLATIPDIIITDTIVGIEVGIVGKVTGVNPVQLLELQLYFFGPVGVAKGGDIFTTQTDVEFIAGGPNDNWGYSPNPGIISNGNFGLQLKTAVAIADEANINNVKMRFYYQNA